MNCPKCGLQTTTHQTPKGLVLVSCPKWRTCGMVATPQVFGMVDQYQTEAERLETMLQESRKSVLAIADKYADARNGEPRECVTLPVRMGDYIGKVAEIAIERSRRKSELRDKRLRSE